MWGQRSPERGCTVPGNHRHVAWLVGGVHTDCWENNSFLLVTWSIKCPLLSKYLLSIVHSVRKMTNSTVKLELVNVQYIKVFYCAITMVAKWHSSATHNYNLWLIHKLVAAAIATHQMYVPYIYYFYHMTWWYASRKGLITSQDDTLYSEMEVTDANNFFAYVPLIITHTTTRTHGHAGGGYMVPRFP